MPTAMVDPFASDCSSRLGGEGSGAFSGTGSTPPESPSSVRHKAPPVCVDTSLMSSAMTTDALSELAFPSNLVVSSSKEDDVPTASGSPAPPPPSNIVVVVGSSSVTGVVPVSSSSSTCTRESDTLSDVEGLGHPPPPHAVPKQAHPPHPMVLKDDSAGASKAVDVIPHDPSDHSSSRSAACNDVAAGAPSARESAVAVGSTPKDNKYNAKVSLMKTSRQGRTSQRWLVEGGETVRLVTGCVPVLRSGKVLFISSSRQSEWILPKGGWEQDETMEESAVRECFEEAGVLGSLGPPLADVQYETRKSKKRRLEQEETQAKRPKEDGAALFDSSSGGAEGATALSSPAPLLPLPPVDAQVLPSPSHSQSPAASTASGATPTPTQHLDWTRIRWLAQQNAPRMSSSDETASVASNMSSSTATAHSQVRMTLFPLYVTDVHSDWPERGRLRTAVDVDQAIAMMDSRPEFKVALQELKARGLHIVADEPRPRQTSPGPLQLSNP